MNERDRNRLEDMREAALKAQKFVHGRVRQDLETDDMLAFAVVRAIEIVGEAANQVSDETRLGHPEIPWRNIIGMRNRVIHGYGDINYDVVWDVATRNLTDLLVQLAAILSSPPDE